MRRIQRISRFAGPLLYGYALALLIGTHLPGSAVQDSFSGSDKILHFTAYTVLSLLAYNFMLTRFVGSLRCIVLLFVSLATFAALDELTQIPVPGRIGDLGDWLANMAGIIITLVLAACWAQYRRSRLASLQRMTG